jgi:hypothetical protein
LLDLPWTLYYLFSQGLDMGWNTEHLDEPHLVIEMYPNQSGIRQLDMIGYQNYQDNEMQCKIFSGINYISREIFIYFSFDENHEI